jgi:hypothetical protein
MVQSPCLPTTAGNTSSLAINTGNLGTSPSPYGFVMFSTGARGNGVLDLAYIADDRTTVGGGLEKWTLADSGTWSNSWSLFVSGTVGSPPMTLQSGTGVGFAGLRGLAGTYDSVHGATLYATTTELSDNRLISIFDSGSTTPSTYSTLQSAGLNYAFRGVDLSPASVVGTPEIDPATGSSALSLVAGVLAMIEQRRRRAMRVA